MTIPWAIVIGAFIIGLCLDDVARAIKTLKR